MTPAPSDLDDLIGAALKLDFEDDPEYLETLWELEKVPLEALVPKALDLIEGDAASRELEAMLLGGPNDGVREGRPLADERLAVLLDLVGREVEPQVLVAAASALGRFADPRVVPALWELSDHDDWRVRWSLTFAASDRDDDGDRLLAKLSADEDPRVRDWATAHLGRLGKRDTGLIRDALAARLDDDDKVTAEEAMCGLAERGDLRVLEYVVTARSAVDGAEDPWEVARATWHMATLTRDTRLAKYLVQDHEEYGNDEPYPPELKAACELCLGTWPPSRTETARPSGPEDS